MQKSFSIFLSVMLVFALLLPTSLPMTANDAKAASNGIAVTKITSEFAENPLGIDVQKPRLSWQLDSNERGQKQTAYEVLVSTNLDELNEEKAGMWKTGKVESDQSINIEYGGKPLQSGERYYWKVRVWDNAGQVSSWSEPSWWEMGLLNDSDWSANWIGKANKQGGSSINLANSNWIWFPEGDPTVEAPAQYRYFKRNFDISNMNDVTNAQLALTADDQYELYVNGDLIVKTEGVVDEWKQGKVYDLTDFLTSGKNSIAVKVLNKSVSPAGLLGKLQINYTSGEPSVILTDDKWKSAQNPDGDWQNVNYDISGWSDAKVLAKYGSGPWGANVVLSEGNLPAPLLRKHFTVEKDIKSARVYVSGLGYYEMHLNGKKVGDRVLDPGHTDFDRTVLYSTFDVTEQLVKGDNAIGVELGRGWYGITTPSVWFWERAPFHDEPKLLLQLEITYTDGTKEKVVTDETWKATDGPTLFDSVYAGETYDARQEKTGWAKAKFDDSSWNTAAKVQPPKGKLKPFQHEPIKITDIIKPVSVKEPKEGVYVFDFGKNVAGWARLHVKGPRGTEVTLTYGEKLFADGTVDMTQGNITGQVQQDHYILSGEDNESWAPKFSYKGYQYVQVTGFPGEPTLDSLEGYIVHTDLVNNGEFSSENSLINQIHDNTRRALLSNLYSKPTDTPIYEKNGWTGDAQIMAVSTIYNFNMPRYYTKWMNDFLDAQKPSGEIPDIIPTSGWSYDGSEGWTAVHGPTPDWDFAYYEIPWNMYTYYGDERILGEMYDGWKQYFAYLSSYATNNIVSVGLGDWLPAPGGGGDTTLTSTAYYYKMADIMAQAAKIMGLENDYQLYNQKAQEIKQSFNDTFFDKNERIYKARAGIAYKQTSNLMPLALDLVAEDAKKDVAASIAKDIKARDVHLATGIIGTKYLLPVLTEYGYGDIAYQLATKTTFPSWGHWVVNGATSLYEHWDLGSRSRNHHMFGSIDEWFYSHLAGIKPTSSGYKEFTIRPFPSFTKNTQAGLSNAAADYDSPYGKIKSKWSVSDNSTLALNISVPVNTTAKVYLPVGSKWAVLEGTKFAHEAEEIQFLKIEDGNAVYSVGSGNYQFIVYPEMEVLGNAYDEADGLSSKINTWKEDGTFNEGNLTAQVKKLEEQIYDSLKIYLTEDKEGLLQTIQHALKTSSQLSDWIENKKKSLPTQVVDGVTKSLDTISTNLSKASSSYLDIEPKLVLSQTEVFPGESFEIKAEVSNTSNGNLNDVLADIEVPQGWIVTEKGESKAPVLKQGETFTAAFNVTVAKGQAPVKEAKILGNVSYKKVAGTAVTKATATINVNSPIVITSVVANPDGLLGGVISVDAIVENKSAVTVGGEVELNVTNVENATPLTQTVQLEAGASKTVNFKLDTSKFNKLTLRLGAVAKYDGIKADEKNLIINLSVPGTNLALNKPVSASSSIDAWGWGLKLAVDGQRGSTGSSNGWTTNDKTNVNHTEWINIDLQQQQNINMVVLYPRNDADAGFGFPIDFTIQVSSDNTNWKTVVNQTNYPFPGAEAQMFSFSEEGARYVRVHGTNLRPNPNDGNLYRMQLAEIEIYKQ
jgi:alpha-L-rhamnosidase